MMIHRSVHVEPAQTTTDVLELLVISLLNLPSPVAGASSAPVKALSDPGVIPQGLTYSIVRFVRRPRKDLSQSRGRCFRRKDQERGQGYGENQFVL